MRIEVRLFATFASRLPPASRDGATTLDVPDGSTVADVAHALGIPADLARVSLVNGRDAAPDQRLAAADVLSLFPPLAGG